MLDPRRLLTFREVAREGSFSRAAERLSLSQPAVSQQISALERQVGARLLDRTTHRAVPTEVGALLLQHADALAERLALADAQVQMAIAQERRLLRLGAFPSALASIVPAALARLTGGASEPDVEVLEAGSAELARRVAAGDLDAALTLESEAQPLDGALELRRFHLGEDPLVAVLPATHRLADRTRIRLRELAEDTWTAPSRDHLIRHACLEAGFEPRIAFALRDPMAIVALVAAGMAVTLLPQLLAGRLQAVRLVEVPDAPSRLLSALLPPAGEQPLARAFVQEARAAYRQIRRDFRTRQATVT